MAYPMWVLWEPERAPAEQVRVTWLAGRPLEGPLDRISTGPIVDALIRDLTPKLSALVADVSQAAEPTIRTVVREELAPKVGMYAGFALLAAGVISGVVGAYFASR